MRKTMFMAVLATLLLMYGGVAQANVITGNVWRVSEAVANDASLANVPVTQANVTFDINSPINLDTRLAANYTIGAFLATGSAFNIVENTLGTLSANMDNGTLGTLLYFTGFVTVVNGQQFTVAHDDGLTLIIGGIDLLFNDGPTAPTITTKTYLGPSGNQPFQLVYGECCGAPAVLNINLPLSNTPVPEPITMLLLGLGLVGLAGARRFRK